MKKNNKAAETVNRNDDPAIWLAMGEDLDGRIGAMLGTIEDLGIADNTYVVKVPPALVNDHQASRGCWS